jgi:WD40 repeat protein
LSSQLDAHIRTFGAEEGPFFTVAFSPDGRLIATAGGATSAVKLWETATGLEARDQLNVSGVVDLAYIPDGRLLLAREQTLEIWDVARGIKLKDLKCSIPHPAIACSRDGRLLAAAGTTPLGNVLYPNIVKIWNIDSAKLLTTLHVEIEISDVKFSPDGLKVAIGGKRGDDGIVSLWSRESARAIWTVRAPKVGVDRIAFRPDGRLLASAHADGKVILWDLDGSNAQLTQFAIPDRWDAEGRVRKVCTLDPDPQLDPDINTVLLHKSNTDYPVQNLGYVKPDVSPSQAEFSPDGRLLASASQGGVIKLWLLRSEGELAQDDIWRARRPLWQDYLMLPHGGSIVGYQILPCDRNGPHPLAFSPDGRLLACCSSGNEPEGRIWDISRRQSATEIPRSKFARDLALSPDGRLLAFNAIPGLSVRDVSSGLEIWQRDFAYNLDSVAFCPDGRTVATSARPDSVQFWDAATGRLVRTWRAAPRSVRNVKVSPDGRQFASLNSDNTVTLWDCSTLQQKMTFCRRTIPKRNSLFFSLDGRLIRLCGIIPGAAGLSDIAVEEFWNASDGRPLAISAERRHDERFSSPDGFALGPDGRVISLQLFGTVNSWDPSSGHRVKGPFDKLHLANFVFTHDGSRLATAGRNHLWVLETDGWRQTGSLEIGYSHATILAMSADGMKIVAAGGPDADITIWDFTPSTPRSRIEREASAVVRRIVDRIGDSSLRLGEGQRTDALETIARDPTIAQPVKDEASRLIGVFRKNARERSLATIVDSLVKMEINREKAMAAIPGLYHLTAEERRITRQLLESYPPSTIEDLQRYAASSIVSWPGSDSQSNRKALIQIEEACLTAWDGDDLLTLGAARYRVGQYAKAVEALDEALREGGDPPSVFAFLAMAEWQLGHRERANVALDRMRAYRKRLKPPYDEYPYAGVKEAELLKLDLDFPTNPFAPARP